MIIIVTVEVIRNFDSLNVNQLWSIQIAELEIGRQEAIIFDDLSTKVEEYVKREKYISPPSSPVDLYPTVSIITQPNTEYSVWGEGNERLHKPWRRIFPIVRNNSFYVCIIRSMMRKVAEPR